MFVFCFLAVDTCDVENNLPLNCTLAQRSKPEGQDTICPQEPEVADAHK